MYVYDKMRDSKLPWLKEIPTHWRITRIKEILQNVSEKNHPDATVLSLYREHGVLPKDSRDDNHNVTSLDTASYKFVRVGELVINKMKAWQGSLGVSDYEGIVSPAYYVCKFKSNDINKKYFHYLVRCKLYAQEFERLSTGMRVGQWDLSIDDFMATQIIIPPVSEQSAIVAYLDDQISRIDSIIAEAKTSIEEYKQWKAAIISEKTLGSFQNRPMKRSGVEWIEYIPVEWNVVRLKTIFSFGKGLPITKDNLVEDGIPVISYGQIHSKLNPGTGIVEELIRYVSPSYIKSNPDSMVSQGDILIADTSEDTEGCGNAVYIDREMDLFAGYHTIILKSNVGNDNKYLSYLFKTDSWRTQIRTRVSGVKLFSISKKILNTVTVIVPPLEERVAITRELDKKCDEINSVIKEKEALIADLEQYKRSLIYEVVTGKRKVV